MTHTLPKRHLLLPQPVSAFSHPHPREIAVDLLKKIINHQHLTITINSTHQQPVKFSKESIVDGEIFGGVGQRLGLQLKVIGFSVFGEKGGNGTERPP